jgi:hypothetical protein
MRAWFAKLGLDWDSGDEAPPVREAHQPMFADISGLLRSMAVQAIAPEFSIPTWVFKEPTVTLPSPTPTKPLAGGAQQPIDPCNVPLGVKQVGKRSLSGNVDLSMFDILNSFHHHWFLSVDHLRAQALSAQKAKDGKIFWVEFTPPFHTHLVKCTVALVPWLIEKVKKVMFMYILELLNRGGPQTFFDLTKGQWLVTQAQKEKQRLAQRRNHALRWESQKAAEEAEEGWPHWQCKACRQKFASCKAEKWHQCSISTGASRKARQEMGKGKTKPLPHLIKPVPSKPPAPPPTLTSTCPVPAPPATAQDTPIDAHEVLGICYSTARRMSRCTTWRNQVLPLGDQSALTPCGKSMRGKACWNLYMIRPRLHSTLSLTWHIGWSPEACISNTNLDSKKKRKKTYQMKYIRKTWSCLIVLRCTYFAYCQI